MTKLKRCLLYTSVGAGRTEVARALFGMDAISSGNIYLEEKKLNIKSPKDAVDNGIMMVSEDRRKFGLVTKRDVMENIMLPNYGRVKRGLFLKHKKEREITADMIEKLRIKTSGQNTETASLSGGNQQKIVIGKWLVSEPKIFILDEPTRGIDVGAKAEIDVYKRQNHYRGVKNGLCDSDSP